VGDCGADEWIWNSYRNLMWAGLCDEAIVKGLAQCGAPCSANWKVATRDYFSIIN